MEKGKTIIYASTNVQIYNFEFEPMMIFPTKIPIKIFCLIISRKRISVQDLHIITSGHYQLNCSKRPSN